MKQKKHGLFVLLLLFTLGTQAQKNAVAIEGKLIKKTPALRDIKRKSVSELIRIFGDDGKRIWPEGIVKPNEETAKSFNPVTESYKDQIIQKNVPAKLEGSAAANAGILLGIEGMATGTQPMDPSICVGTNHVIELVNDAPGTGMKIWDKNGSVAEAQVTLQQLSGFRGYGDPIALYDQWSDRYIVTEFIIKGYNGSNENGMTIMVSATNDPTGQWNAYKWTIPENFTLDYPKWSVSTDGIYLHTNNFSQSSGFYSSSYFAVFNKDDMYAGNSTFRSLRLTQNIGDGYATCNAQIQGNTVPSGGQLFVTENGSNQATVISCSVNWSNNTFTQSNAGNISLASFNETVCNASRGACVSQPNNGSKVETLSGRVMNQPICRQFNGYTGLVFAFTVNAGSNTAGIRWVELRKNTGGSWTKYQEATWHPNSDHQFMPSIAYDKNGNIGLAYSTGSSSTYLSVKYTGRKNCDALGQMTIPETTLKAGNATSSGSRWGDYNHLIADPDGNSLWMVSMYGKSGASGSKGTYISRFDLPQCSGGTTCDAPGGLNSSAISTTSATVSWSAVSAANSYNVDYKTASSSTWINAAANTTALSVNLSGLNASTNYDWRVRSNCSSGNSTYSTATFTTSSSSSTCPSTYDNSTNGTRSGAATIPFNTDVKGLINTSSDVDFYRFDISTAGTFTVSLSTLPADFDLKLFKGTTLLSTSDNGSTTSESITYNGTAGTYYARVYGWNGAQSSTQCYTLKVQLGTATQPIASAANTLPKNTVEISPNPAKNYLELSVAPSSLPGEYQIFDMQSREITRKTLSQAKERISIAALKPGAYILVYVDQDGVKSVHKFIKE
jgi:hypothetical protein